MTTPQTFVIVGASTGLGRAAARVLARDPAHRVIVAGRDVDALRAAVPGAHEALAVDLVDLADAKRFAGELLARGPIHGLVCNAGIQDTGPPTFTREGIETVFAVNHLAHLAIVQAARAAFAPGARVVWIGSSTLEPDGAKLFRYRGGRYTSAAALARGEGDPGASVAQAARDRYATSKLCDLLAMSAVARAMPELAAFAFDPGLMPGTGLARAYPAPLRFVWHTLLHAVALVGPGMSNAGRSGRSLAWVLTSPALAGQTGRYYDYRRRALPWTGSARTDWVDDLYATSTALISARGR